MASPFPGMDPWLEAPELFPDLHQTLISQFREAVNATLPRPYYTALGTRLYIDESDRRVVFDRSYDVARFDQRAAYDKPAMPSLNAEQQTWAEEILKAKGLLS